jgi:uncharacterized protein (TIGR02594 family)
MDRRQVNAYALACEEIGTRELKGDKHNPDVVQYFADVGHSWVKDDETAWCAAFVGAMLERVKLPSTRKLNARSYLDWGDPVDLESARAGDIVVFSRGNPAGWQGHVGFFVRVEGTNIEVLGGNQSDQVIVARYPISRLLGVRRWPALNPTPAVDAEDDQPRDNPIARLIEAIVMFVMRLLGKA